MIDRTVTGDIVATIPVHVDRIAARPRLRDLLRGRIRGHVVLRIAGERPQALAEGDTLVVHHTMRLER